MMPVPDSRIQRAYRVRVALFLLGTVLLLFLLGYLYQGIQTLHALDRIESQRDHWQRPSDVIQALNLREGSVVVDFGSGVGYFALKLSPVVGKRGRIIAEDIRREPLVFLRIRAFLRSQSNLRTIRGEIYDPRLPAGFADSVLIANTYHELTEPIPILRHLAKSLKPGGRLVIVDRGPRSGIAESREGQAEHHELRADLVETEVRNAGFAIISRDDHFIDRPLDDETWWLLVANKP
jgi:predicted methyltransferase